MSHTTRFATPGDNIDSHADHHVRLVAQAKTEALRLRREAVRDFGSQAFANVWRDADAVWQRLQSPWALAGRSARRWQARLARHTTAARSV